MATLQMGPSSVATPTGATLSKDTVRLAILQVDMGLLATVDWLQVKLLVLCFVAKARALHHHQSAPGYQGPGYSGYGGYNAPAAGTPYQGYADYSSPPQPYSFGYDTTDEFGNRQFRSEQSDANNAKTGSYGYTDVNGLYRRVSYVADANGFRATVDTNEPGTAPRASADVVFNAAPVVPPVPAGTATPASYGARAAPGYNNALSGYGGYGYDPYGRGAGVGYGGYGRLGSGPSGAAVGGYFNDGRTPSGYGVAGYAAGQYGPAGYGRLAAGHHGFRRRR
ncbi:prisilkin-39 [Dermacentor silvarum]|nr:prisilkin-39 [Dermacentor silvarum]